ncbi:MAG: prefoldin subunit alpha [Candidatus Odinarchaeia archaeon]
MSEEEVRKLVSEYQVYELQLKDLAKRLEIIQNTVTELDLTKETIEGVKKSEKNTEFLAPIKSTSFVKAQFTDTKNILMGLGANIVAEIPIDDALEKLNKQKSDLQKLMLSLKEKIMKTQTKLEETRSKLQREYSNLQKQ